MATPSSPQAPKKNNMLLFIGIGIVVVVIIAALLIFLMGSGTPNNILTTACIAIPGYACQLPVLHNGNLTVMVGQNTGISWTQANIFLVIAGSPNATAVPPLPCEEGFPSEIASGQTVSVILPSYANSNTCAGMPTTVGQQLTGYMWVAYQTSPAGAEQFVRIATLSIEAS